MRVSEILFFYRLVPYEKLITYLDFEYFCKKMLRIILKKTILIVENYKIFYAIMYWIID